MRTSRRIGLLCIKKEFTPPTFNGTYGSVTIGNYNYLNLLSSGTLTIHDTGVYDLFVVGGGGGAGAANSGGGGGGYTGTLKAQNLTAGTYTVTIGAGGAVGYYSYDSEDNPTYHNGGTGGTTSFKKGSTTLLSKTGGKGSGWLNGGNGGSGGGHCGYNTSDEDTDKVGGAGGSNGSNGRNSSGGYTSATGQGTTTYAFAESATGLLYAGGGGGGGGYKLAGGAGGAGGGGNGGGYASTAVSTAGTANTGGGGGGAGTGNSNTGCKPGGSGIAIIRWAK